MPSTCRLGDSVYSRVPKTQTAKTTGLGKLPDEDHYGRQMVTWVAQSTATVRAHSSSPPTSALSHRRRLVAIGDGGSDSHEPQRRDSRVDLACFGSHLCCEVLHCPIECANER